MRENNLKKETKDKERNGRRHRKERKIHLFFSLYFLSIFFFFFHLFGQTDSPLNPLLFQNQRSPALQGWWSRMWPMRRNQGSSIQGSTMTNNNKENHKNHIKTRKSKRSFLVSSLAIMLLGIVIVKPKRKIKGERCLETTSQGCWSWRERGSFLIERIYPLEKKTPLPFLSFFFFVFLVLKKSCTFFGLRFTTRPGQVNRAQVTSWADYCIKSQCQNYHMKMSRKY